MKTLVISCIEEIFNIHLLYNNEQEKPHQFYLDC